MRFYYIIIGRLAMTEIIIYTKDYCPYCVKAKKLLEIKGQKFTEIDITKNPDTAIKLVELTGGAKQCRKYSLTANILAAAMIYMP